ncbi:hypothetical protein ACJMK2_000403, partial [Sinanodonta woodiana]
TVGLREKIILDPQWMIDALSSLITAEMFIYQNPAIIKVWYAFKEKGKLTHELIDAIWNKNEKPDFHDNKEHILLVMEKLNIIARPMSYTEDGKSVKVEDYYLAPCMLREATPKRVICQQPDPKDQSTSVLCFVCKGKFLPTPIFHRLVGACLTLWPIAKIGSENQIYCGCCVFHLDQHHRLILHFLGHVIFARVIGRGVRYTSQSSKLCIEARKFIFENLQNITRNLGQSLEFEMHIQCPNYDADSTEGLLAVSLLQKHEKAVCHSHDERHIHVSQKLLRLWFEDEEQTVMEGVEEGKGFDAYENEEDASMDGVLSTSIMKGVTCPDPKLLCQILQKSQQAVFSSQSTLEANCLSVELELHDETPADGNCFFEAVSSQLRRLNCIVQKSPQELRQEVAAFMRTNKVLQTSEGTLHLESFIYNESFDDYCSRMARDGEWADHVVVVAMARMLQMDIMIVTSSPSSGPENIIAWVVGQTAFQGDPILLGHVWESHYMSLQPIGSLLPEEILSMDNYSIQLYKKALDAGMEKVYNIRVMVVGQFGVGKTTLIKRILDQPVHINEKKSTEGIDVHKHCCKLSLDTGEWIQQVEDSYQLYTLHRLHKLLSAPDQKPDITQEQGNITEVSSQTEKTPELDATKSNVPSTTSVPDQEVQSSTQLSIARGDEIHHVDHVDKETAIVDVPQNDTSIESEKKIDTMMEIIRLVNENADKLVKNIENYAAVSVWDFAGQYPFYSTHQMFLTSRAIYLLVIDLSQQITDLIKDDKCFLDAKGINPRQVLDLFQIWMNSIHSSVKSPKDIVPVILVGTHVDKLLEGSRKEVIDMYFEKLRNTLREKPTIRHLMDTIAIDNTQPDPMLEELKKRIFELSKQQSHWGEERPARWIPLEQAIMTLKASGTKIVPLSLIEEINMSGSVKIEDRDELELFLKFQHELGTIIYFR